MGSSLALHAAELVAAAVLAGTVLLTVMALGVWWLRRLVRRRLEWLRLLLTGPVRGARPVGEAGSRWIWSLPLPDRRWWGGARARRELWGAVRAAEHAVAAAHRGGAPTGDLDGLCQRLRRAAGSADCSMAIWQRSAVAGARLEHPGLEINEVLSAARQIQAAASDALASVSRPMARELADDVRAEVVALRAGIASAAGGRR
jgi:hypothetical protein